MPRVSRPILALVACTSLLLAVAAPVVAHAELVDATRTDGAHLSAVPNEVVLTFSDELNPAGSGFAIAGPDGSEAGGGTVDLEVADRNVMRGTIIGAASGAYSIGWTAVAADGHEETGTIGFTVGTTDVADTAVPAPPAPTALVGWLCVAASALLVARRAYAR